jgi:hypothetical protein
VNVQFGRVPGVDCTNKAEVSIEGYAPADGRAHGSLDVIVRVCQDHHDEACRKWLPEMGAPTPFSFPSVPGGRPAICGDMTDFRDSGPQDVEPDTQDVVSDEATADVVMPRDPVELEELMAAEHDSADDQKGLGLLDPMPYTLTVNNAMAMRGELREVRNAVAHLVTEWLASDPEGLALDAQTVNLAFNLGAVQQELEERGEWFTVFGAHSAHPMRIKVTKGE